MWSGIDRGAAIRRRVPTTFPSLLAVVAWVLVAVDGVHRVHQALSTSNAGEDLIPLRQAGVALRTGHPIYHVPGFVYPPPGAILGLLPAAVSLHAAEVVDSYLEIGAILLSLFLLRRFISPGRWGSLLTAIIAAGLIKGDLLLNSLPLENLSILVLLPLTLLVALWGRRRWDSGAIVLALTLVVKPVLLPLLVIPLTLRRPRPAVVTLVTAAAIAIATIWLLRPFSQAEDIVRRIISSDQIGNVYNLSLVGIGRTHGIPTGLIDAARIVVLVPLVIVVVAIVGARPAPSIPLVGSMSGVLLGGVFLAGSLSENHYIWLLIPGAVLAVASRSNIARASAVASWILCSYSVDYLHRFGDNSELQARFVSVEVLVLIGSSAALWKLIGQHNRVTTVPQVAGPVSLADPPSATLSPPARRSGRRSGKTALVMAAGSSGGTTLSICAKRSLNSAARCLHRVRAMTCPVAKSIAAKRSVTPLRT
jgi:arabinofuranan 3-O-arabinosyltransferase